MVDDSSYEEPLFSILDATQLTKVKDLIELLTADRVKLTDAQIKEAIARLDDGPEVAN